jgi:hypothetical protein
MYIIEQKVAERLGCLVRQFHEICHFHRNIGGWNNTSRFFYQFVLQVASKPACLTTGLASYHI